MPAIRAEALVPSPMATGLALLRPAHARALGRGLRAATGQVPRSLPHGSPPSLDAHVPLQTPVRPSASASPLPFLSSAVTALVHPYPPT